MEINGTNKAGRSEIDFYKMIPKTIYQTESIQQRKERQEPGVIENFGTNPKIEAKGDTRYTEAVKGVKYGLVTIPPTQNDTSTAAGNESDGIISTSFKMMSRNMVIVKAEEEPKEVGGLLDAADHHIITISSAPVCILPDTLEIYERSLKFEYGTIIGEQHRVAIKDILDVQLNMGILWASLGVSLKEKSDIAHQINNLRKKQAEHASEIIWYLVDCARNNSDISMYQINIMINKMYMYN